MEWLEGLQLQVDPNVRMILAVEVERDKRRVDYNAVDVLIPRIKNNEEGKGTERQGDQSSSKGDAGQQ